MPPSISPTVRRRRLGAKLRHFREEQQLAAGELAKRCKISQTKLSAVEGGRRPLTDAQIRALVTELDVDEHTRAEMLELHAQAAQPGWWDKHSVLLTDTLELFVGLETESSWIRRYDEGFIPALLQTEEYARAIAESQAPFARTGDIEHNVEFRMKRQQRLQDPDFTLTCVLNEGLLWRHIGGTAVMRQQLQYLAYGSHPAQVNLHVVPFKEGAHPSQGMTVAILTFNEEDPDAVYADYGHTGAFLERPSELRPMISAFGGTLRAALSTDDSRERIAHIATQLT